MRYSIIIVAADVAVSIRRQHIAAVVPAIAADTIAWISKKTSSMTKAMACKTAAAEAVTSETAAEAVAAKTAAEAVTAKTATEAVTSETATEAVASTSEAAAAASSTAPMASSKGYSTGRNRCNTERNHCRQCNSELMQHDTPP
jgi:hypothetical protein